jgi:hypothetical protein
MKIKKLKIFAFAKLHAIVGAIVGLFLGIIYSFGGLFIDVLVTLNLYTTSETPGLSYGTFLAFGALLGMPVIFTIVGFIIGVIVAIIYNLFAKYFIKLDFGIEK